MGTSLDELNNATQVAQIVHHGEKLILPTGMTMDQAIDLLKRRKEYLQQEVAISETFDVFPWDGAYSLDRVLKARYGWSPAVPNGPYGSKPPQLISIKIGPHETAQVAWGRFSLPNVSGFIECGAGKSGGRYQFALHAKILRQDEATVRSLFDELRTALVEGSIYRGKAIKIRFRDDDGDLLEMPEPSFLDTEDVDEAMLVYPQETQDAVETSLFTPIQRVADCLANGIPIKRGVLLGGKYGTGKTLAAKVASKYAVRAGLTYIYISRADELSDAIVFSKQYQSPAAVIFCEDIDRAVTGERSVSMDDILNIIDGIDSKSANLITVMTTNHLEAVNPAMLRPGRLDAVIDVRPPDAKAVEKLLRIYGKDAISEDTDLTGAGVELEGQIPAVIAEVIKRAKLAQLRRQEPGTIVRGVGTEAILEAAKTMRMQLQLLEGNKQEPLPTLDQAFTEAFRTAFNGNSEKLRDIHDRVCN